MLSVIEDYNIKKSLNLDDYWYILREAKFLTLINYKTLEVKEFFHKKQKKEKLDLKIFKRKGKIQ